MRCADPSVMPTASAMSRRRMAVGIMARRRSPRGEGADRVPHHRLGSDRRGEGRSAISGHAREGGRLPPAAALSG